MDPNNPQDLGKLRDAIRACQNEHEAVRVQCRERTAQYAGDGYGDNEMKVDTPFNVYNVALRVYKRRLFSGRMKANVVARSKTVNRSAYELGIALNDVIREIGFDEKFEGVLQQALIGPMGIVKIGIVPESDNESRGYLFDADQPYVEPVLFEDFAWDTNAKAWDEIDWCANRYRIPLADVFAEGTLYDMEAAAELYPSGDNDREDLKGDELADDSVRGMATSPSILREEMTERITVWDVWLPREGLLVTIADQVLSRPLRVVPWEGPETGPYRILSFDRIQGNILPIAPGGHLLRLSRLLNNVMSKLGEQAEQQKDVLLVARQATEGGEAIMEAKNGSVIGVDDPKNFVKASFGGVNQNLYAFMSGLQSIFNYLGGNIDMLAGLGSKVDTLGQAELLSKASNGMIDDMQADTLQFLQDVLTDVGWYIYTDPTAQRQIIKRIEGTSIEIPVWWTPQSREAPWFYFNFEVDPYSTYVRSPGDRLRIITQLFQQVVAPMIQYMQMTGMKFDLEGFWRIITRYSNIPELGEMIKSGGQPITGEPGINSAADVSIKAPFTQRDYVRHDAGSGQQPGVPGAEAVGMMSAENAA